MKYLITALIGYLLGTINVAYILGRIKGIDIRETGSHNAGASNAKLNFGWTAGVMVALIDFGKAALAIFICSYLFPDDEFIRHFAGFMAIIGHIYPFYMQFRGGKGFACYIGMLLALDWKYALVILALDLIIGIVTNYIVAATFFTVIITPIYYIYRQKPVEIIILSIILAIIIIYKHRINIIRYINHEEKLIFENRGKNKKDS